MIARLLSILNKDILLRKLTSGGSAAFLMNLSGVGIGFVLQLFLTNILGASSYGLYLYVLTWVVLLAMLARFGMHVVSVRFLPVYILEKSWSHLRGLMRFSRLVSFGGGALLSLIVAGLITWYGWPDDKARGLVYILGLVMLPFYALIGIEQSFLRAFKASGKSIFPDNVLRPMLIMVLGAAVFWGLGVSLAVQDIFIYALVAVMVGIALSRLWLHALMPHEVRGVACTYQHQIWLQSGLSMVLITASTTAFSQVDILMVGMLSDDISTAHYGVAAKISNLLAFVLVAINIILGPMIAELHAADKKEDMQRLFKQSALIATGFTVMGALVLFLLGRWGLTLFGEGFESGYPALMILVFGQLVNTACGSVGILMTMTGHEKRAAQIMGGTLILNITLNALLIPLYGIDGAAVATAVSIIVWNIILVCYCLRVFQINTSIFSGKRLHA